MTGFEIPLVLWIFGYLQPGRTAAAANGVREPLGSYGGACPSFGPSRSHRFGTGCGRTLFVFRVFGGSGGHLRVPGSNPSVSLRFRYLYGPVIALPCAQGVAQQFLNFLPLPQIG